MRFGLSWGAQAPHHLVVAGARYEVRTTRIAGVWTAYGTVNGVCVEATGDDERQARQRWQAIVETATPLLEVERRVDSALDEAAAALDEAAAALDEAAQAVAAVDSQITPTDSAGNSTDSPASPPDAFTRLPDSLVAPADIPPLLPPETCEVPRFVDRRLRPRLRREN